MILYLKHITIEGPGTIHDFFKTKGFESRIVELGEGHRIPDDLSGVAAVVILGGPMNVYEEGKYPFLKAEHDFIKKMVAEQMPLLGICLGSQLLAKAVDAKISKSRAKEIGCASVQLTDEGRKSALFAGLTDKFEVFQWHEDTFAIPEHAQWLAQNEVCAHQAFSLGRNAFGLQFHIEVTEEIVESWIKKYFKVDDAYKTQQGVAIMNEFKQKRKAIDATAQTLYGNFLNIIQSKNKLVHQ